MRVPNWPRTLPWGTVAARSGFASGSSTRTRSAGRSPKEETTLSFSNPLAEVELLVTFTDLLFPAAGIYCIQLFAGDVFLRERRFQVVSHDPQS